jgi:GNAT superfamily N-acetyltransferase
MSEEIIVPFDESLLRVAVHTLLHSNLISEDDQQLHACGIIRKNGLETTVLAFAIYRYFLTTFDTVRFEIDELIVDEKERNRGLGTRLLDYLIEQAKHCGAKQILVHCDLTNTIAHRFFFHRGLTILLFEFYLNNLQLLPSDDQIHVMDITDLPEQWLIQTHDVHRQLRPHLSTDQQEYINQIRDICRTGPARMIIARNENEKNEILGLAVYRVTRNSKCSKYIYCDDLVTNENHRSFGVGRCLINYMKNEGQKLGIDQLILDSGCQRGRAHKFYYREGFIINRFGFTMSI